MATKIIVSNRSRMQSKYSGGIQSIDQAIQNLVNADNGRGISTSVVYLDDTQTMNGYGTSPINNHQDQKQNKDAIDAVYTARRPDYLMILGAPDVVPHQHLSNPMQGDGDPDVPSDLPYACFHHYSTDPRDFLGPDRVIGRLPDAVSANDPGYLVDLLNIAEGANTYPNRRYTDYFSLSARVWQSSTSTSTMNIWGNASKLKATPTDGPNWTITELNPPSHFINCHGAQADPRFYGQQGSSFPVSMEASGIHGKLVDGTVATVECCYGAELYDPAFANGQYGICQEYLVNGTYGYFGSTTIAYGPPTGNGAADIITQQFLIEAHNGASLGRAALIARQNFIHRSGPVLSPTDLKTIAQFYLLGDPSLHPVAPATAPHITDVFGFAEFSLLTDEARHARREELYSKAISLVESIGYAESELIAEISSDIRGVLENVAKRAGLTGKFSIHSYDVNGGRIFMDTVKAFGGKHAIHVILDPTKIDDAPYPTVRVFICREERGRIVRVDEYVSR